MTSSLRSYAQEYQDLSPDHTVLPTYHMVTTVASDVPPEYVNRVDMELMTEWVEHALANGIAVILDLQPGRADLMEEFERIRPLLYYEHVHLAVDPEWYMLDWQIPGLHIGQIEADEINVLQAELEKIAIETGFNRLLIVHQFKDSMIIGKENIVDYPHVEMVICDDGAFNSEVKIKIYNQYVAEPGYDYMAIKLFAREDDRLIPPNEIMELAPQPSIIVLQ